MTLILSLILFGLSAIMLFFASCRLWVMHIAKQSIQGSDLHMLKWCVQEQTRAWAGFHITFTDDAPYQDIKEEMIRNITHDLKSPQSNYRRGMDLAEQQYVFYKHYSIEDIICQTVHDKEFFKLSDQNNKELVYKFHDGRQLVGALFDHTVWDGIRMFNETLSPAIKSKPFESRWLLGDRYIPIFSECFMLYALSVMGIRWFSHTPLTKLADQSEQKLLRHSFKKQKITALKQRSQTKFTAALLATWANRLFHSAALSRNKLRFGLVVGMNNPRFRNNYSLMIIDVHRQNIEAQAQEIQKQMRSRAIEVMPTYHLLSLVEMQSALKKTMVDCLFSPGIFEPDTGPSQYAKELFLYIVPTSMPIYSFACSLGEQITISTTWNSPEIDLDHLSSDAAALYTQGESEVLKIMFESEKQFQDHHKAQ